MPKLSGAEVCSKPCGCFSSSSVTLVLIMYQKKIPVVHVKLQDFPIRGGNIVA